jgi:hypothetical protein
MNLSAESDGSIMDLIGTSQSTRSASHPMMIFFTGCVSLTFLTVEGRADLRPPMEAMTLAVGTPGGMKAESFSPAPEASGSSKVT